MSIENRAIQLLKDIPDDMDYPTDEEFRVAFNIWYHENVTPFLKSASQPKEKYICKQFLADPCGSSKCNNCGKRRHEHG